MLNDVHPPPIEPRQLPVPVRRAIGDRRLRRRAAKADRAHSLERSADHGMGTNLVFANPEDRGGSFNTMMSAVIVGSVLLTVAIVAFFTLRT